MTGASGTIRILSVTTGMLVNLLRINSANNGPVRRPLCWGSNYGRARVSRKYVLNKKWRPVNMLFCIESIKTWCSLCRVLYGVLGYQMK